MHGRRQTEAVDTIVRSFYRADRARSCCRQVDVGLRQRGALAGAAFKVIDDMFVSIYNTNPPSDEDAAEGAMILQTMVLSRA
jgi:hypothetical protein